MGVQGGMLEQGNTPQKPPWGFCTGCTPSFQHLLMLGQRWALPVVPPSPRGEGPVCSCSRAEREQIASSRVFIFFFFVSFFFFLYFYFFVFFFNFFYIFCSLTSPVLACTGRALGPSQDTAGSPFPLGAKGRNASSAKESPGATRC